MVPPIEVGLLDAADDSAELIEDLVGEPPGPLDIDIPTSVPSPPRIVQA